MPSITGVRRITAAVNDQVRLLADGLDQAAEIITFLLNTNPNCTNSTTFAKVKEAQEWLERWTVG